MGISDQKFLYINSSGSGVTHSSYSSRQTFKHCPREFQLTRVDGWSDKKQNAAPLFGKCIEAGVQAFEESERQPGVAGTVFVQLWNKVKDTEGFDKLVYTASEGDWMSLLRAGIEMMQLYEIRAPKLPIVNPRFQQTVRKLIFPGTHLGSLENKAIFDLISYPPWDHPMLPKIEQPRVATTEMGERRPLIIDIKTSGIRLDAHLITLDPQLAEYAWMARVPDVAFLWFVKHGHGYKKSTRVTMLSNAGGLCAGEQTNVLMEDDDGVYIGDNESLKLVDSGLKGLRGKLLDAKKAEFKQARFVSQVSASAFTKQELIFAAARMTEEQMNEVGRDVAQTTVEMVRAHEEKYYPKLAGIRFPNQKCNFCSMRYICLGDSDGRDKNLTRRGEEWLDADYDGE